MSVIRRVRLLARSRAFQSEQSGSCRPVPECCRPDLPAARPWRDISLERGRREHLAGRLERPGGEMMPGAGFSQGALGAALGGGRVRPSGGCAASRRGAPSAPPGVGEQRLSDRVSQQADLLLKGLFCFAFLRFFFLFSFFSSRLRFKSGVWPLSGMLAFRVTLVACQVELISLSILLTASKNCLLSQGLIIQGV